MFLREVFNNSKKLIAEGGNVSSTSPGWQGAADQEAEEIDLKIHNRDFMVGQLRTLLAAQNESFKATYGKYIWEPKLLKSGQMFSGSSLQFFDIKGVNTQDFMNKLKKTKVGDIDTQIDQDMGDEVTAWLKSIIGKKVGNGTFLGFNSSLSSIWLLDDPQVRIQVDYELGPYDPKTRAPTEWFAYSHSSHYDDMAAGIKGVFHKYINRALTHAQSSTKYVARVLKKGVKISDAPVTDSDYSFAVSSAQGGGMSMKYKPYIDPTTGQPMEKDGIPVMQQLDPKDRDYIQNLDQQFQINFGRKRTAADQKLQGSFVGTIQLMNKAFTPEQNEAVARAFIDILFGPGSQMITKDDPERDRETKFAAVDAMLLGGSGIKPLNLPNGKGLRQEAVKMAMDYADKFNAKRAGKAVDTEVAEDAAAADAAKPNYARQGIKHIYNRLPDGRVSSVEMKNAEFVDLCREIAENGGTLNGVAINLKVDGAGIRFGKDESGRPFFMTSKVTTPLYQDDVGYFTNFGQERGQDAEQLARTKNYDDALALITGSKFIQTLPPDTIVQAEMLYNPMAEKTTQGLKFVNIPYDPKRLGRQMTLVPFMFKQYSTGDERPDAERIKKRLLAAGDSNIKIISNQLEQKGINVNKIIQPVLNLDPKDKANAPAFDQAKQALSDAIINSPKLAGKDALGDNMEGVVVNMPSGRLVKVTSTQMKSAMAAKMSQPAAKREGPLKTAVVAIGSFVGHRGHEELFNFTINKAKEVGGDPYLFIGNAVGADDPIPPEVKVQTWQKLYPSYAKNIGTVMQGGTLMQKIKHELISPQPGKPPKYDNIIIMVGEDRKDMPLAGALMKAVNKFPGYEHVKVTLEPTPRGTGMSFTKLRNILKDPNATPEQQYAEWAKGFDEQKLGKDWILHLMDISRKGMGIAQQPAAQPATQPVAETRLFNALIRPIVETDEKQYHGWEEYDADKSTQVAEFLHEMNPEMFSRYGDEYLMNLIEKVCRANPQKSVTQLAGDVIRLVKSELEETARMSAAVKLQRAFDRERAKSDASRRRGEEVMAQAKKDAEKKQQNVGEDTIRPNLVAALKGLGFKGPFKLGQLPEWMKELSDGRFDKDTSIMIGGDDAAYDAWVAKGYDYGYAYGIESGYQTGLSAQEVFRQAKSDMQNLAEYGDTAKGQKMLGKVHHRAADRVTSKQADKDPAYARKAQQTQDRAYDRMKDVAEKMLPKSAFAGSDKNKLGPAAHLKGSMKRPAQQGDLVGGMEEGWKEKMAGIGLAGALALGAGNAHARVTGDEDPGINRLTGKPNVTQVSPTDVKPDAGPSLLSRYGPGYEGSPAAYIITVKGKDYKFAGRNAEGPGTGPIIKVPGGAIGIRGLAPVSVELGNNGEYYIAPKVDEGKIKGADGKACWKGKRYAGTKNGKDICVPVSEEVESIMASLIEQIINK